MNATHQFSIGDTFISNGGRGPLRAQIDRIEGDQVFMTRSNSASGKLRRQFKLPLWFLSSRACGWERAALLSAAGGGG